MDGSLGPIRWLEQPQYDYYQDDYDEYAYYQVQLIAPHPFTSFTVIGYPLSSSREADAPIRILVR